MAQSLYTAAAGMKAQQQNIDTIANNIANINTGGYRKSRADFSDAIYSAMQNNALPADGQTGNLQLGHGAILAATRKIFTPGALQQTDRSLDAALAGEGFFAVENPDGPILYTRDGNFSSSPEDGRHFLVTAGGNYVLDQNGARISSLSALDRLEIGTDGEITADGQPVGVIGIWNFANPDGLESVGSKNFLATEASGQAQQATAEVRQGFMESSNVELSDEMTELIAAQRAYSLLSRAISTADNMRAVENNIRG